jgi:hypothetical protein
MKPTTAFTPSFRLRVVGLAIAGLIVLLVPAAAGSSLISLTPGPSPENEKQFSGEGSSRYPSPEIIFSILGEGVGG